MIVSSIYKNVCRTRLLSYGGSSAHLSYVLNNSLAGYRNGKNSRKSEKIFSPQYKNYSSETQAKPTISLPSICDYPVVLWPSIFYTLRNFLVLNMVIKNRFDREFDENEFIIATKRVLHIVSRALATENYEQLEGLVTQEAIDSVKGKISTLSDEQKELITVNTEDVYLTFPHKVSVSYEDEGDRQRKFVEIMVVHHCMRGFGRMKERGESFPINMLNLYQDRIFIANYRFLREFTEGVDSPWILNLVNHCSGSPMYGEK